MTETIDFSPYQTTIDDIEITLTSTHGDHISTDEPLEDQLVLEISKAGESYREIFDGLHSGEIGKIREAFDDIERIVSMLEQHQTHAWQCEDCGTTVITQGRPGTCDCGAETWEKDEDIEQLSEPTRQVLEHLYILDPRTAQAEKDIRDQLAEKTGLTKDSVDDAIEELITENILERTDDGIQRY